MELLDYLPKALILSAYASAAGRELEGKANSPESSSALVANAFGYFIDKPNMMPPMVGLNAAGWPAESVALEANVRFPWRGGLHPWLDALVITATHMIGVESKRFEPYRGKHVPQFSDAYDRDVWSPGVAPYLQLMAKLRSGAVDLNAIDAAQLIKHALALSTQAGKSGKQPVLYYVYANPKTWPDGRAIPDAQRALHAAHIAVFAEEVEGASVRFFAATYADVLNTWLRSGPELLHHARAVDARFALGVSAVKPQESA